MVWPCFGHYHWCLLGLLEISLLMSQRPICLFLWSITVTNLISLPTAVLIWLCPVISSLTFETSARDLTDYPLSMALIFKQLCLCSFTACLHWQQKSSLVQEYLDHDDQKLWKGIREAPEWIPKTLTARPLLNGLYKNLFNITYLYFLLLLLFLNHQVSLFLSPQIP